MKKIAIIMLHVCVVLLLTVLTQVGGLVYLLYLITRMWVLSRIGEGLKRKIAHVAYFLVLYSTVCWIIVPRVAAACGRVPLCCFENNHLRPLNLITCMMNRHYVKPELRQCLYAVAIEMNKDFPETTIQYLDCNFPFIDGFPLLPHLSHDDGCKADIAFCYKQKDGSHSNESPGWIGYGVCEKALSYEKNLVLECEANGYWQYGLTDYLSWGDEHSLRMDLERTKHLTELFANQPPVGRIFLEPHLVSRMNLDGVTKIRFHGCNAVRHDDHLHVQLK
ncbi:MAG: hypothetical protein ACKVOR_12320 [Flavobacteriales bacterium]